jgi:hypothetical protein
MDRTLIDKYLSDSHRNVFTREVAIVQIFIKTYLSQQVFLKQPKKASQLLMT